MWSIQISVSYRQTASEGSFEPDEFLEKIQPCINPKTLKPTKLWNALLWSRTLVNSMNQIFIDVNLLWLPLFYWLNDKLTVKSCWNKIINSTNVKRISKYDELSSFSIAIRAFLIIILQPKKYLQVLTDMTSSFRKIN